MKKLIVFFVFFVLSKFCIAQEYLNLCKGTTYELISVDSTDTLIYFKSFPDSISYNNNRIYDTIVGGVLSFVVDTDMIYEIVSINGNSYPYINKVVVVVLPVSTISIPPASIHHVTCPDGAHPNGVYYPYSDGSFYLSLDDSVQNYAWIDVINDSIPYGAQIYDASTLTGLRSGTYYVVAHGVNGCEYHDSVTIEQPDPWVDLGCLFDTVCSGQTGCIQLELYGGTPPYSFTWFYLEQMEDDIDTIFLEDTTRLACGLEAGGKIYLTYMYDSRGCKFLGEEIEVIFSYLYEYVEDSTHIITTNPIACYGSQFLAQAQSIGYGDYVWHVGDSVDSVNWWTWVAADSVLIADFYTPPMTEPTLVSVDFYDQHNCVTHDSIWIDVYNPEVSMIIEAPEIITDSACIIHVSPLGGSLYLDGMLIVENIPNPYTLSTSGISVGEHTLKYAGVFGQEQGLYCEEEVEISFNVQSHPFVTDWDQEISIYPNPATTILNLSSTEMMNFTVCITDVTGRVILREKVLDSFYPVDVSSLTSGIYLLRLETPEGANKMVKFVKR